MTGTAIAMFAFGAILLWGGLAVCLSIAIRKKSKFH
ncbi:MetS family NSS transporter small subunit [Aneurinibacillus sp. REN35]